MDAAKLTRSRGAFGVVCGLLVGVMLAMLIVPARQGTTTLVGQGGTRGTGAGGTAGSTDAGAAGDGAGGAAAGATAAGGTAAGGTAAGALSATGNAVTGDVIRIGIAQPDLGPVRNFGPRFDNGDVHAQVESVIEGWRSRGRIPINGRDVQVSYRSYFILSSEEQRAACVNLVQQDHVFAVAAPYYFGVGSECVAGEQQTPLVTTDEQRDEVYARTPMLFSTYPAFGVALRNAAHWANERGLLAGHKVGMYVTQSAQSLFDSTFVAELQSLGYDLTVEATRANASGGPEDALAVQRMKAAGVDVVFFAYDPEEAIPSPTAGQGTFLEQAASQDYHPQYATFPLGLGTGDTTNSLRNGDQWNGAVSMVYLRHGERGSGLTFEPATEQCLADFEAYTGEQIPRTGVAANAEEVSLLQVCDSVNALLEGLSRAGEVVDGQSVVQGLESIQDMSMASSAPVTFGPGKHWGITSYRSWRWDSGCGCGKVDGDPTWRPFPVR